MHRDLADEVVLEDLALAGVEQHLAGGHLVAERLAQLRHGALPAAERDGDDEEAILEGGARLVSVRQQRLAETLDARVHVLLHALPRRVGAIDVGEQRVELPRDLHRAGDGPAGRVSRIDAGLRDVEEPDGGERPERGDGGIAASGGVVEAGALRVDLLLGDRLADPRVVPRVPGLLESGADGSQRVASLCHALEDLLGRGAD
jgi:hypothetical protein